MLDEAVAAVEEKAEAFLRALAAGAAEPIPSERTAIVLAHPDDETIGIGGQLGRLQDVTLVHVTDGAPRNGAAQRHGFATADAYAAARRQELRAAMALAGIPDKALVSLGIADQEASLHMPAIARRVAALYRERRLELLVTHAFEGGHPDHDATALAVHAAAALLRRDGFEPALIEMPLYHLGSSGWTVQRFVAAAGPVETEIHLTDEQRRRKQAMLDAHGTQRDVLSMVATDAERFRPAPAYDFGALPNEGRLLYEGYGWGMTGPRWQALAAAALQELGLGAVL
ncbi:MAG: PIG-L family deacetylase [Pseudomonadota bacterium]|nr:PIG-L family deacetylase [Pseudomonadota bacterium]